MKSREGAQETSSVYNISNFPPEELIDIDLNQHLDELAYLKYIDELNAKCSRGGAIHTPNIITTFDDDLHPGTIIRYKGKWKKYDVTTCFLVRKGDLYLCSYCHKAEFLVGANWVDVKGSLIKVEDAEQATYHVKYDDAETRSKLIMDFNPEFIFLLDHVGKDAILCGLWCLKYGNQNEQKVGYHAISHNLCEAARLTIISKMVSDAMDRGITISLGIYKDLFQKWAKLCKILRDCNQHNNEDSCILEAALEPYNCFGIREHTDLINSIKIMLKENERKRYGRRLTLVKKTKGLALKYYNRSIVKKIRRWRPKWKNTGRWSRAKLLDAREDELLRRMRSGGDSGIWRSIHKCILEPDLRYAKLIMKHTDVNLIRHDLRLAVDDTGEIYRFDKRYMFSDPMDGFE